MKLIVITLILIINIPSVYYTHINQIKDKYKRYTENGITISKNKNYLDESYIVDSVIIIGEKGIKTKYIYNYDSNLNLILENIEILTSNYWEKYIQQNTYYYDEKQNLTLVIAERFINDQWYKYWRYTYSYDSNENIILYQIDYGRQNEWSNFERYTYNYDSFGILTIKLYEVFENEEWINSWRHTYSYDSMGKMISELYEVFENEEWKNSWRHTYSYDSNGSKIIELHELFSNGYLNSFRTFYTYNPNLNLIMKLYQEKYDEEWINTKQTSFTYGSNKKVNSILTEIWENGILVNYQKESFTYNLNDSLTVHLLEEWVNFDNYWRSKTEETYTYDSNGNLTSKLMKTVYDVNLDYNQRWNYEYDMNGNLTMFSHESWNGENWEPVLLSFSFVDSFNRSYFFELVSTVNIYYSLLTKNRNTEDYPINFYLSQNYPNPFNPKTTIEYSIPKQELVTLKIFDVLGREMQTLVNEIKSPGSYNVEFDASNYSSGVYFYQMKAGDFNEIKKFILLK